jgi:hypothetical protein
MAKLADLLTGAPARHALAHRDITTVFGILRDVGVYQTDIARATKQRPSEVPTARRDSSCRDLAHEPATLRSAA